MIPPFSLLAEAWIPVLRADGAHDLIRPAAITADLTTNPVVAPAWGRADFDAATCEFLVGLLATACGDRADEDEWDAWFRSPPPPERLDEAFASVAPAFVLDGDGPRFGQDLDPLDGGEARAVSQLLIEAPGANTVKRNLDHFVRRGGVETLSRAGAAMALFTLQTYAPSGGAGHRVSVRGGGPLTTLLVPGPLRGEARDRPTPLWRTLWLAVPHRREAVAPERVFPWLGPTRVSDKGRPTTPEDTDPLQAFWGMPRRIRLVVEPNPEARPCDLTGRIDAGVVRVYRTRPHGTSYAAFRHPLSPHYRAKPAEPFLPLHGQPGRVGYRHWVGLVADGDGDNRLAAEAVTLARRRLGDLDASARLGARLRAAGYDMDNMKAREFIESEMPLHLVPAERFATYDRAVRRLVAGAREADGLLRFFVRQATSVEKGGVLDLARARFWERTETAFGQALDGLSKNLRTGDAAPDLVPLEAARAWLAVLQRTTAALFDDLIPLDGLDALGERAIRARVKARTDLGTAMHGWGKLGQGLFKALDLAVPEVAKTRRKAA
ncbi:MAG: type I-E CRISPR-associated protein Cse1/CasA [Methylobacterium frigidaeris]